MSDDPDTLQRWDALFAGAAASPIPAEELIGWTPVDVDPERELVAWTDLRGVDFTEPFLYQTILYHWQRSGGPAARFTGLPALRALRGRAPALEPTGFIFHVSACGSTLLSRQLAALDHNLILSQPTAISAALLARPPGFDAAHRIELVQDLVHALAQPRGAPKRHCIVKFLSWNVLHLALFRAAYPHVPWVFLYREPVEVVVGNVRAEREFPSPFSRFMWRDLQHDLAAAHALTQIPIDQIAALSREEYCARTLGNLLVAALAHLPEGGLAINYRDLVSDRCLRAVAAHFGMAATEPEFAAMLARSRYYSKDPGGKTVFVSDTAQKRRHADDATRQHADRWTLDAYRRLEALAWRP
jgi:hypothetical protein